MFADVDPKARGAPYAEQCQRLLDLRDIALTTLQAAVLLGAYWTCEGYPASESIYVCIACRLAQLLDLPSRPTFSLLERELNRRGRRPLLLSFFGALVMPRRMGYIR